MWRYVELEAAATELHVISELDKALQAVSSQYTSKYICWPVQFAASTDVDLQMQRLKKCKGLPGNLL